MMIQSQKEYADVLIRHFKHSGQFGSARIIGSLASAQFDAFSDIDIELQIKSPNPVCTVRRGLDVIRQHFPVCFYDWAKSLAPERVLMSVYIEDVSPFWNIDISVVTAPNSAVDGGTLEQNAHLHALKLWLIDARSFLRESQAVSSVPRSTRLLDCYNTLYSSLDLAPAFFLQLEIIRKRIESVASASVHLHPPIGGSKKSAGIHPDTAVSPSL